MSRIALICVLLCVSSLCWSAPPEGGFTSPKAKQLASEAAEKFQQKRYGDAARLFEAAYKIYPSPKLLYNLALVWEADGRLDRVHRILNQYLNDAKSARKEEVAKWQIAIERRLKRTHGPVEINVAPPGTQMVVGVTLLVSPWKGWLPAGDHTLRVDRRGYEPLKLAFTVEEGRASRITTTLTPKGGRKRASQPLPMVPVKAHFGVSSTAVWGWVALGVGVATIGAGAGVNLGAGFSKAQEVDSLDPTAADYSRKFDRKIEQAQSLNMAGYALYGVGGALVVTGVAMLIVDARSQKNGLSLQLSPSPTGGFARLSGRF